MKESFFITLGAIGSYIAMMLGGWDMGLQTLIAFMAIDYISGLTLAGVFKKSKKSESGGLSSHCSWRGLVKKGMMLLIVYIGHRLDLYLELDFIRTATVIAFISNELISVIENMGLMGIPLPKVIFKAVDVLNGKAQ